MALSILKFKIKIKLLPSSQCSEFPEHMCSLMRAFAAGIQWYINMEDNVSSDQKEVLISTGYRTLDKSAWLK